MAIIRISSILEKPMRPIEIRRLALCLLLPLLYAARADAGQWPLEIFEVMDDKKIVVFLKDEEIAASPEWQPAEGAPPLSIGSVLKTVGDWVEKDPRLAGSQVQELALKPIHGHEKEHRWYYLVRLHGKQDPRKTTHYLIVLLSGKVTPAIVEPMAIK